MDMVKSSKLVFTYTQQTETEEVKTFDALKGIDLTVYDGEFVAILGRNGSGKSTLAKHMNALLTPTSGTILIRGYDTLVEANVWEVRKTAGMVFQNPDNQIIATIVEEDVAFGPENLGIEPNEIRRRVHDSLESVGMLDYRKSAPHYLSGGQKQRIAIAGVLAMKPACIILDEPTAMLDPSGRREVMQTITRLNREEGITIILITHYMEEAVRADRVVVMEDGEIIMNDVPKKVFSHVEELKACGLDVPQVTEVAWLLKRQGLPIREDILTIEEMVDAICQLK